MQHAPYQLSLAQFATVPGGSRKGSNTFLRSRRQRQKAYELEKTKMIIAAAKKHNAPTPGDMPPDALAALINAIEAVRFQYLGV